MVALQGVAQRFMMLLEHDSQDIFEQSIWGLGNIAGDGIGLRDFLLAQGLMDRLIQVLGNRRKSSSFPVSLYLSFLSLPAAPDPCQYHLHTSVWVSGDELRLSSIRNCVWLISNLARGKPKPPFDRVSVVGAFSLL